MEKATAAPVPLLHSQIEAASRLHARLEGWRITDNALGQIRDRFPGFDKESCLVKSVAVNTLYGTQVLAIVRMARHVHETLSHCDTSTVGIDLVEQLAMLRIEGQKRAR